jgi:hypothetical protein
MAGVGVIHYHGTPITPASLLSELGGRNFCVSYAAPHQVAVCHEIGQSVMLDNGAFSFWKTGKPVDWDGYYRWAEPWLEHHTTWAVIPDVIDGTQVDNVRLLVEWKQRGLPRGAPVWHMHESIGRLLRYCMTYERVCIGSSGEYAVVGSDSWHRRMEQAFNALCPTGPPPVWIHMLRGMSMAGGPYPFASVDSTDIARNHNRPRNTVRAMADRWDRIQAPARWTVVDQLALEISA